MAVVPVDATGASTNNTKKPIHRIRPALPFHVEKELIEKQNKHVHVMTQFGVATKIHCIADKFYSKYCDAAPATLDKYQLTVERRSNAGMPTWPQRESQVIGWCPPQLEFEQVRQMNFISAPKLRCDMTIYGEKLQAECHTERRSFNGLRFFLS